MRRFLVLVSILFLWAVASADTLSIRYVYDGEIDDDNKAKQLLRLLEVANQNDIFVIEMTTVGGSVKMGYKIAQAMHDSKATVIYKVPKYAYSMGAMLVCESPQYVVSNNAVLMFHMAYTTPLIGDPYNVSRENDPKMWDQLHNTFKKCGFLTKQDIAKIDAGGEVWITGAEINKRLRSH